MSEKKPTRDETVDEQAPYFFHQGTTTRAYEYLGAHRLGDTFVFRVWAPNAESVSVCADFNAWDRAAHPMTRVTERGVWELRLPSDTVEDGQCYKYCIRNKGCEFLKSDPYAFLMEKPPETASRIADIDGYRWRDESWLRYRKTRYTRENITKVPLNVYEVHAGSWKRHEDGSYYSYRELADDLVTYVKQMGYTHVELMPLSEHPFDGSWGYQVSGYYAATSRFGTPQDLMYLIDTLHEAGIGVILDWVPAHFPKDAHGLYEFDGQPLYEYQGLDRREHPTWGTRCFDVGREEVQSFLISNACFWAEKYHVDGLRVDAVAAMLYLDFDRLPHQWIPNRYGDNKNLEAVAFFQKFNSVMAREFPDVMTIAEESTAWANLTHFENGGLGFTLKWNMGWMNDALSYLEEDPLFRKHHHHKLTFSLTYAYGENYLLPISHDEVVHGKKSLLDRAPGDYWKKFATTRTFLAYMMTHPGKKLLFMGCEYGPFREWDFDDSLEWFMLDYDMHAKMQLYTAELNHLYLEHPALWELDGSCRGFEWIDADNEAQSIYSYRRRDAKGRELIVVLNFTPIRYDDFLLAVPKKGYYRELFNSDSERFGGSGCVNTGSFKTEPAILRSYGQAIRVAIPPMGAAIFRMTRAGKRV